MEEPPAPQFATQLRLARRRGFSWPQIEVELEQLGGKISRQALAEPLQLSSLP